MGRLWMEWISGYKYFLHFSFHIVAQGNSSMEDWHIDLSFYFWVTGWVKGFSVGWKMKVKNSRGDIGEQDSLILYIILHKSQVHPWAVHQTDLKISQIKTNILWSLVYVEKQTNKNKNS